MRALPRPNSAFAFEVIVQDDHPQIVSLGSRRPPAHFHPYQTEYVEVLEGFIGIEMHGHDLIVGPEDGLVKIEPWTNHGLFPPPSPESKKGDEGKKGQEGKERRVTRFLMSGAETAELFRLDALFFENWYGYQDEVVMSKKRMDLIQLMCVSNPVPPLLCPFLSFFISFRSYTAWYLDL